MRKALVVGIDHYDSLTPLYGCVSDAHSVKNVLERNSDGTINFDIRLLTATSPSDKVNRRQLRAAVEELFRHDGDVSLFYFAGHGHIESTGGYLVSSDAAEGDDGLALGEVLTFANKSKARNKVILLDSCHSGIAGTRVLDDQISEIAEGVTILTASTADQYASEQNGGGVFTGLLVDALNGAAGNLVGDVTPGSVYAHVDQSLGSWGQRPVFKTNVNKFVFLRKVQPPISLGDLQRITEFFPAPGHQFRLDPSYEPESDLADPANTAIFAILQNYAKVNLVVPVGATHMYFAAMGSRACQLTALGEHYRRLVENNRI